MYQARSSTTGGPIMRKTEDGYVVVAAGPTTTYALRCMKQIDQGVGLRAYGQGGMGEKTLKALQEAGCCLFSCMGSSRHILQTGSKRSSLHEAWKSSVSEAMWFSR